MSMLGSVTKGKQKLPHLLLLYGPDGIGKSTFGSQAPKSIFLGPEKGTMNLDVSRFPSPKSWGDVKLAVKELTEANHGYKTLVVDTLDWLEPLVYDYLCKRYEVNSIEKAAGGYGKGYREAFNEMVGFRDSLSFLREQKGMNIILLAHSKVATFEDPATEQGYSRYELKLQESGNVSIRAMWREYVDAVLFCNFETFSKGEGKQARGVSTRDRKMWTERDAAFDAKNRFGLPFEMNLNFIEYDKTINQSTRLDDKSAKVLLDNILEMTKKIDDEQLLETVMKTVETNKDNPTQLSKIEQRLKAKIGE